MHGRQRKELTPDEEAKKAKEQKGKVAAYQYAMSKIFDKRSKGELDADMMTMTGQVLAVNPDIHTLWNIRKETLKRMKGTDPDGFMDQVVPKELDFTEMCLKNNPKSYGAWHHRHWMMKETDFKKANDEFKLCGKYLEYDDRNFHTWDYRRFLSENSALVTLEEELKFTTEKISSNFSNFSSWHLRSKILPQLSTNYLDSELELIRNALFTDPKDQSAWLYHMWLLKFQLPKEESKIVFLQMTGKQLVVCFNQPVSSPKEIDLNPELSNCNWMWENPLGMSRSKLWLVRLDKGQSGKSLPDSIKLTGTMLERFGADPCLILKSGDKIVRFDPYFDEETKPKTPQLEKVLKEELAWVVELEDMEPDIKWPALTSMMLMRMINFVKYKEKINICIDKLLKLDSKRTNYYNDLRSKFIMEWSLVDNNLWKEDEADLHGLNLTALYHPERLCYKAMINCSNNLLRNGASLSYFLQCEHLDVSNNQIESHSKFTEFLRFMPNIKSIIISGNPGQG